MPQPFAAGDPATPFVGRDAELARLHALLEDAHAGRGSGALIEGDPGIGKTALVSTLSAAAATLRVRVLQCRGFRGGENTGFAALHELLHPVLDRLEALPQRQRAAVEAVFGIGDGAAGDRLVLSLATLGLLEEVAQDQPLLLIVEDVHWLDPSSIEILTFLPRRVESAGLLVVATTRLDPARPSVADSFPEVMRLTPLKPDEAHQLVTSRTPDLPTEIRGRVVREASGNPLALTELAAEWARTGQAPSAGPRVSMSRRLEETFLSEVHALPIDTQRALLLTAAGEDAPRDEVIAALRSWGLSEVDLEPAVTSGLLHSTADRFAFRHPLVASALYDAAGFNDRSRVHAALADAAREPVRRAQHRAAATTGWDEDVAAELDSVADQVFRQGAKAEASTVWRRAAALVQHSEERARLLTSAAEAARQAGASVDAAAILAEVRTVTAPTQFALLRRSARTDWLLSMTADHRGRSTLELVELSRTLPEPDDRIEVLVWAATKCFILQEPEDIRATVRTALRETPSQSSSGLNHIALALVDPSAPLELAAFERFRAEAQHVDGALLNCLAFSAEEAGDLSTAERCWTSAVSTFHDSARTSDETIGLCGRATPRVGAGDLTGGLADAEQALRLSHALGLPVVAAMAAAVAARAYAWRGQRDRALHALHQAKALPAAAPFARVTASAAWAAAIVALHDGRHADALDELAQTAVNAPVALWAGADLAEPAARTGRPDVVEDWMSAAAAAVQVNGSPHLSLLLERSRALLAVGDDAEDHFEAALEHGRRSAGLDLTRTQLHYGEWLRRRRRITEAREHLLTALRGFEAHAALPLAERARQELQAAGGAESADAVLHPAHQQAIRSLTAQELLVARLAAEGLSNKEIADQVYLSHRTVGSHLHHAFAKLQISRRSQLLAVLGSEG
ncbi:DNA-binding CsgD family transcriptional regulator [Kineococcus radiotolerans]|uniref:DNA-binding CsgD family transcriptional regulator n=1 Tax=Kineococcus radiotolerans TaxID=131568 RepID=A0A7W4TRG4_KINRA|nr:LuxR family transcriptional regulator [Kineococcus radiotolerans]MBB2903595.1 DNA-binding CsgD family transcriptional regulator [Kineococcus radiotolerans]